MQTEEELHWRDMGAGATSVKNAALYDGMFHDYTCLAGEHVQTQSQSALIATSSDETVASPLLADLL